MVRNGSKGWFKVVLLGNPRSTNNIYRHARGVSYMSKDGRELKASYAKQARSQWPQDILRGEIEVDIALFFGDKRIRDWDNAHKLSMDALTGIVWEDDSQIYKATVEKFYDKNCPRIEINVKQRKGT